MAVTQYTTPTFTLTFTEEELDLTQANNVYVTFESPGACLTKSGDDLTVEEKQITVRLSQEETGRLGSTTQLQVNWTLPNGVRAASTIETVEIDRNLLRRVIE